jgi:hypothetical protein
MMRTAMLVAILAVQPVADPFLTRLDGRWAGEGTVLNQASAIEMAWGWTLDGQFLELTFRNQMSGPRPGTFEGRAFYRALGSGRYRGFWVDNSGAIRPIEARVEGDALVSSWGTPDTEMGETTYRLAGATRLEVTDRVRQKGGAWRTFGQSVLMKR